MTMLRTASNPVMQKNMTIKKEFSGMVWKCYNSEVRHALMNRKRLH